ESSFALSQVKYSIALPVCLPRAIAASGRRRYALCAEPVQEARVTQSDEAKISEDRREALRYALAIGSGTMLTSALATPAAAQSSADNTLDRIRADKVMR